MRGSPVRPGPRRGGPAPGPQPTGLAQATERAIGALCIWGGAQGLAGLYFYRVSSPPAADDGTAIPLAEDPGTDPGGREAVTSKAGGERCPPTGSGVVFASGAGAGRPVAGSHAAHLARLDETQPIPVVADEEPYASSRSAGPYSPDGAAGPYAPDRAAQPDGRPSVPWPGAAPRLGPAQVQTAASVLLAATARQAPDGQAREGPGREGQEREGQERQAGPKRRISRRALIQAGMIGGAGAAALPLLAWIGSMSPSPEPQPTDLTFSMNAN